MPGTPTQVEVDTSYFIGNTPDAIRISAAGADTASLTDETAWWDLVPLTHVLVDTRHRFLISDGRRATHLRLDVHPDGGLTRLRCFGTVSAADRDALWTRFLASLPQHHRAQLGT